MVWQRTKLTIAWLCKSTYKPKTTFNAENMPCVHTRVGVGAPLCMVASDVHLRLQTSIGHGLHLLGRRALGHRVRLSRADIYSRDRRNQMTKKSRAPPHKNVKMVHTRTSRETPSVEIYHGLTTYKHNYSLDMQKYLQAQNDVLCGKYGMCGPHG